MENVLIYSSAERTPISKHISAKETDMSARSSTTACPTPEFRMSVLLARDEHSGSQKELQNRSPAMRTKSVHSRDKSGLRMRDTLRLVNEKQPTSLYEVCYFYTLKKCNVRQLILSRIWIGQVCFKKLLFPRVRF